MRNLKDLIDHIDGIYAPRNALVRSDLAGRMSILDITVGKLYRCYRKGPKEELGIRLANVFSRICCVAENFRGELKFVKTLASKYPMDRCTYCQKKPCECPYSGRKNPVIGPHSKEQTTYWSLTKWQEHFEKLYGAQNRALGRGPNDVLLQIFGEVSELLEVAEEAPKYSVEQLTRLFAEELSDVLAWTIGFANLFEINLEEMVVSIYGAGCPACRLEVCKCPILRLPNGRANTITPR